MPKGKIIGLDWGHKRIGVAISDSDGLMAFTRTSIENDNNAISNIGEICTEENVQLIVLGYPLNLEGEKNDSTDAVEAFAEDLKEQLHVDVEFHDERLTSVQSEGIITSIGIKKEDRKKETDIIAASLILKNYLDLKSRESGD
ncbi:Holliday junction resolvase RuvX [Patescibacteria group bacterium]